MSEKINQIIENLKTLTLLEASELVIKIEETFGVDASVTMANTNSIVNDVNPLKTEIDEKTEFSVMLEEVPTNKKIPILKVVRGLTGLGLKEAKQLVESAPKEIQESVSKDVAEDIKQKLEEAGAKVSLK